jgi:hypothetical protein
MCYNRTNYSKKFHYLKCKNKRRKNQMKQKFTAKELKDYLDDNNAGAEILDGINSILDVAAIGSPLEN